MRIPMVPISDPLLSTDLLERIFGSRGWLSMVEPQVRRQFISISQVHQVAADTAIAWAGQEGGGPFGLLQGRVGCWGASELSPPVLAHVAMPGDWFGHGPMQLGVHRSVSFRALEPCILLYLPAPVLREMAAADPTLFRQFARLSETSAQMLAGLVADTLVPRVERRLAAVLVKAARNALDTGPLAKAPLPLGQAALADLACASRPHVNRVLRRWASEGLVETGYNHLQIVSLERLRAIACGSSQ